MSFPDKERRKKCWDARDEYWKCLDESKSKEDGNKKCKEFRNLFIKECPKQWIGHFDRKYDFLKYKAKIEKDGFTPYDDEIE